MEHCSYVHKTQDAEIAGYIASEAPTDNAEMQLAQLYVKQLCAVYVFVPLTCSVRSVLPASLQPMGEPHKLHALQGSPTYAAADAPDGDGAAAM